MYLAVVDLLFLTATDTRQPTQPKGSRIIV